MDSSWICSTLLFLFAKLLSILISLIIGRAVRAFLERDSISEKCASGAHDYNYIIMLLAFIDRKKMPKRWTRLVRCSYDEMLRVGLKEVPYQVYVIVVMALFLYDSDSSSTVQE